MRIMYKQGFGGHQHPRGTKTALYGIMVDKACCKGSSFPSVSSPSIVNTSLPPICPVRIRQEETAFPSRITVQAPHSPTLHPSLVPVNFNCSLKVSSKRSLGPTFKFTSSPLTMKVTEILFIGLCLLDNLFQCPLNQDSDSRFFVGSRPSFSGNGDHLLAGYFTNLLYIDIKYRFTIDSFFSLRKGLRIRGGRPGDNSGIMKNTFFVYFGNQSKA